MDLIYLFRRLVFIQVMLGVVAFCMAEQNPGMLLIAGTLGALSWYVAEGPAGRPLPQWAIHLGAIAAVIWLAIEVRWYYYNASPREINYGMIVAMGHFTMFLQILQLYGHKTNREYALILVLGLMQMIGASVLSISVIYGVLLAAYCIVALFTVLLFQFKAISDRVLEVTRAAAPDEDAVSRTKPVFGRGHRWQFRGMAAVVGLVCAAVAVLVFVAVPRWGDPLHGTMGRETTVYRVGFSNQVSLGSGTISGAASRDTIAKLTVSAPLQNQGGNVVPGDAMGMLLRGAAMDRYDQRRHMWRRSRGLDRMQPLSMTSDGVTLADVPQQVTREVNITLRHASQGLFTPYPPVFIQADKVQTLTFNPYDQRITLGHGTGSGALDYTVRYLVSVPPSDMIDAYLDRFDPENFVDVSDESDFEFPRRRFSRDSMGRGWFVEPERFRRLALDILEENDVTLDPEADSQDWPVDVRQVASILERYLQQSPQFAYSLEIPPLQEDEDPIVAFMFRHRRGHCELFASGLAAMARSLGLAARVVTGYRVSEFNHVGGYYVVRESNAHAWTEIYCDQRGWLAFDATPPETVAREHERHRSLLSILGEIYDHLEFTWISSFLAYDERSRQRLFGDIHASITESADDDETWLGGLVQIVRNIRDSWQVDRVTYGLIAVITIFIIVGIASLAHTLVKRHRRVVALQLTTLPRSKRRGLARRLRFYLHMLELLERHGLQRPRWQSPYDFARSLVARDADRYAAVVVLTELFYEIRFGHRNLDDDRKHRVRTQLRTLETALAAR